MLAALLCCICTWSPIDCWLRPLHHLCRPDVYIDEPCVDRPTWRWWHCEHSR